MTEQVTREKQALSIAGRVKEVYRDVMTDEQTRESGRQRQVEPERGSK